MTRDEQIRESLEEQLRDARRDCGALKAQLVEAHKLGNECADALLSAVQQLERQAATMCEVAAMLRDRDAGIVHESLTSTADRLEAALAPEPVTLSAVYAWTDKDGVTHEERPAGPMRVTSPEPAICDTPGTDSRAEHAGDDSHCDGTATSRSGETARSTRAPVSTPSPEPVKETPKSEHVESCNATWKGIDGDQMFWCSREAGHRTYHATEMLLQLWYDDASGAKPHQLAPAPTLPLPVIPVDAADNALVDGLFRDVRSNRWREIPTNCTCAGTAAEASRCPAHAGGTPIWGPSPSQALIDAGMLRLTKERDDALLAYENLRKNYGFVEAGETKRWEALVRERDDALVLASAYDETNDQLRETIAELQRAIQDIRETAKEGPHTAAAFQAITRYCTAALVKP